MIVICVMQFGGLTVNNFYTVISISTSTSGVDRYWILNDIGQNIVMDSKYFISLEEYRSNIIDSIMI